MPHGTASRHRSPRRADSFGFAPDEGAVAQPMLVTATDICWWATILGVTVCFGGRAAIGQLIFVVGAGLTTGCWLLHQLLSKQPRYIWTGSEWLWCAGIAIGAIQLAPLPQDWLLWISPQVAKILPHGSFDRGGSNIFAEGWHQLSLAPHETTSGLVTFVAYALMFLVLAQRVQSTADVARMMCGVGLTVMAMASFATLQYLVCNGKYYWFYSHPYMSTDAAPLGSFTNRNHLAQFLALGVAPLIWWIFSRIQQRENDLVEARRLSEKWHFAVLTVLLAGLVATSLTALLTLSRGGCLSLLLVTFVTIGLFFRIGLASPKIVVALAVACVIVACAFYFNGYDSLASRFEHYAGRDDIWKANVAVARDFPVLGTGVGTHADAYQLKIESLLSQYNRVYTHAESGYLQVASETGIVGLVLALLFIGTGVWWCCGAIRRADALTGAPAVAVLASLLANATHSVGDFFWYTPSCMLLLLVQLVCACRLYQMTCKRPVSKEQKPSVSRSLTTGTIEPGSKCRGLTGRIPRLGALTALCGVLVLSAWMIQAKLPAALAEPDQMRAVTLAMKMREFYADDEEYRAAQREKRQATFRAARLNPHDSRLVEESAEAYVAWFNERQEMSENPLPLGQLRDAVKASQFESPEALQEWLGRAVGKNVKLLRVAIKTFRKALRESPLRAHSYIRLAELGFLESANEETESIYLHQASVLRPHHPEILFAVGREALLKGDLDRAMDSWRIAFESSPRMQGIIADLLAGQVTPEFFLEKLKPSWLSIAFLARAFTKAEREEEAHQMWVRFISEGRQRLKTDLPDAEYEATTLELHTAHLILNKPDDAIRLMTYSLKRLPYSFPVRLSLGRDLAAENRFIEAAEHLQWCAARQPDDAGLQQEADHAVKERLKSESAIQPRVGSVPRELQHPTLERASGAKD